MTAFFLTGAASGIGKHLALALARRGKRVFATDVNEAGLALTAREAHTTEDRFVTAQLDVTRGDDWERAFTAAVAAFGAIDVLVNVAGFLHPGRVADLVERDIDTHLAVNVKGVALGTQAAAKHMTARGQGHVINVGSLASLAPVPGLAMYCASKFAVRGFTLAAATELAEHGVAVTLIMPDAVKTPMLDLQKDFEEAALTFSGAAPLDVTDVERVFFDVVLPRRPLEVTLPLSRGALARVANGAPALSRVLYPILKKKGLAQQARSKKD